MDPWMIAAFLFQGVVYLIATGVVFFISRQGKGEETQSAQGRDQAGMRERMEAFEDILRDYRQDGRAIAALEERTRDDSRRRNDGFDVYQRLARLEEFKDETVKKLDEQARSLRIVTRLEEQMLAFKDAVTERLDRLERRWEPALVAVSKAMAIATNPD